MSDQPQMPDLSNLMAQAQEMLSAQQEAADVEYTGQSGGGAVQVVLTGGFEFLSVTIAPEALEAGDAEMLGDLVLAAINDGTRQAGEAQEQAMGASGLDLGSLGGLLGGGE